MSMFFDVFAALLAWGAATAWLVTSDDDAGSVKTHLGADS